MKLKLITFAILIFTAISACGQSNPSEKITAEELSKKMKEESNLIIVDVAEPDEFRSARLEGAVNIPIMGLKDNFEKKMPEVDKDDEIILYCYSGMRSRIGVEKLKELGYTNVVSLVGGVSNWQRKGLKVNSGGL